MKSMVNMAIRYLSKHYCSEKELITKLRKEFFEVQQLDYLIEQTINRLRELNLINDGLFAESISRRHLHKGNLLIQQILKQKGIQEEIIERVLENIEPEEERALHESIKKMASFKEENSKSIPKLIRFLSGRGFSHGTIRKVLSQQKII
jgi:regulatory protein